MKACVCVWSVQSSWLCVCGLLPLCDEVQMRAVVPYARHQGHRGASRREGWMEKCVDHDHGRLCTWHYPPLASSFDWRPSTFTGYAATLCVNRAALDSHIQPPCFVSRLSSSREALRGDSDRKHRLGHWPLCCRLLRGAWVRVLFFSPFDTGNVGMAASGAHKCPKSEKLDEAQALAKSCAGRPDFLPCDGLSICATHSHGKCFKLHWCCHLGWCHCKFVVYQLHLFQRIDSHYHRRHCWQMCVVFGCYVYVFS